MARVLIVEDEQTDRVILGNIVEALRTLHSPATSFDVSNQNPIERIFPIDTHNENGRDHHVP